MNFNNLNTFTLMTVLMCGFNRLTKTQGTVLVNKR